MRIDSLDSRTEEALVRRATLFSLHHGGHDKLIDMLANGEEDKWDVVCVLAKNHLIEKRKTFNALASCLVINIPVYLGACTKEKSVKDYWSSRTVEAVDALSNLYDPKAPIVVYRNIPLLKDNSYIYDGPNSIN